MSKRKRKHRHFKNRDVDTDEWLRRQQRRQDARKKSSLAFGWSKQHGVTLTVTNGGEDWRMTRNKDVIEWWPSTGRLAVNRDYKETFFAPTWNDAAGFVSEVWFTDTNELLQILEL